MSRARACSQGFRTEPEVTARIVSLCLRLSGQTHFRPLAAALALDRGALAIPVLPASAVVASTGSSMASEVSLGQRLTSPTTCRRVRSGFATGGSALITLHLAMRF